MRLVAVSEAGIMLAGQDGTLRYVASSSERMLRFTMAHELAHLVMHWTPPVTDPEREADEFAREFLLPEHETRTMLRQLTFKQLGQMKTYWRVSMGAPVKTADARQAQPPSKIKSMYVQMSRLGWRTNGEPWQLSVETPTVIDNAIDVHVDELGHSIDELASLVDLQPDEFRQNYNPAPPPDTERSLRIV